MFGVQFYPTPKPVVEMMMDKVDWSGVHFILEPSAGKGDIVDGVAQRMKGRRCQIECVEIDPDLREVLRGRGRCVVGDDFLRWTTHTRYDLIVMNPPFRDGDKHLAHALDLMQHGGQIVCLLNAATLQRTESAFRADLHRRLKEYGATIETLYGAFSGAERRTDVDVSLVYVNIPKAEDDDSILEGLRGAVDVEDACGEVHDIVDSDFFRGLVQRYNFEARAGLEIIDRWERLKKYIPAQDDFHETPLMNLGITSKEHEHVASGALSMANAYLRELRRKYWAAMFGSREMQEMMTYEVREKYMAKLEEFRAYDFTLSNILQIKIDLSKSLVSNIEDAILAMFEKLTFHHSMSKNTNVHYYNGWKTNDCCKIKPKVIVPFYGLYDGRWGGFWSTHSAQSYLMELEKILTYLDNGRTGGLTCDKVIHETFVSSAPKYQGQKVHFKYFDVEFKKKGTIHIFFTNAEVLKKFNIFGGRKKNWLPPSYGKTAYDDMGKDAQAVVDSFEGKAAYADTLQNARFYLPACTLAMLGPASVAG